MPSDVGSTNSAVAELVRQFAELSQEWEPSPQREALIEQIKKKIFPSESVVIDSALCLGLGSLEKSKCLPLPGKHENKSKGKHIVPDNWLEEVDPGSRAFKPVGNGSHRSYTLYQLIVFETALETLREKFTIETVRFQDPSFTKADGIFLEKRGHVVLTWPSDQVKVKDLHPCDPNMLSLISSSTMLFAPFLDRPVVVEVICAATPSLYLGNELLEDVVDQFLRHPRSEISSHLMETFEDFVLSRDFEPVEAFGSANFSLMWPADMTDEETRNKIQDRWLEVDAARADNFGWDSWNRVKQSSKDEQRRNDKEREDQARWDRWERGEESGDESKADEKDQNTKPK